MSTDVKEKTAIVTGAAGGFGRAIARALVNRGIRVGLCDIDAEKIRAMEGELGGERALALPTDIGDPEACASTVRKVVAQWGNLDILINNAALGMGAVRPDHFTRTVQIEDIDVAVWRKFMDVNMNGAFYLAKAAVPLFRQASWGRIINVTTSFFTMLRPGFAPYGPAKAALEAWSASLAGELEGTGITVNVVVPGGPADTAMVPQESGFDRSQLIAPERIAYPILWLCSDEAAGVTGARFIAADWNPDAPPADPTRACGRAAWPDLGRTPVWPTGGPRPEWSHV